MTSEGSLAPLQPTIVLETKDDDDLCEVSVEVSANTNVEATPGGDGAPHDPDSMEDEDDDTEPDLDALAASSAYDQPDLPHSDSVQVESLIDK